MTIKNLLLDLDGTLTDSRPGITRSIDHALTSLGLPVPAEAEMVGLIGPPLNQTFEKLLPDPTRVNVDEAIRLYRERFTDIGIFENSVYSGIPESLEKLLSHGYHLFLATSKPQIFARRILKHFNLDHLFQGIYGSEMDGTRQDKTTLIGYLLETENLNSNEAVMVGDRSHDILGGIANNLQTIGVLWGYGSKLELESAGVHSLAAQPHDLELAVQTAHLKGVL
jgi:phosphoglycolate phosphatase